jgi:hypothetical protein
METLISANSVSKYNCTNCNTICFKKNDWDRHLLTGKHQRKNGNAIELKILPKNFICNCGKIYLTKSGLWKHKKTCDFFIKNIEVPAESPIDIDNNLINIILKENSDIKSLVLEIVKSNTELQKQTHEMHKQMMEICKNSNNTTNISHNNSHNKTFNLQFFLNEQCKDAMNIMEFVDTFQLQFSDLERIGEVGYVEGISNIIISKLNEMDVHKRPIHCSDAKREIMYVKDNDVWDKDNETNDKIRLAIRYISKKNCELVIPWRDLHPGVRNYDHRLNDKYQEIIIQSLGGKNTTIEAGETKIIRKISKMVLIDKCM